MDNKQTIKTPVGDIQIGIGTTPTFGTTASFEKIAEQFEKVAKENIISSEQILENDSTNSTNTIK